MAGIPEFLVRRPVRDGADGATLFDGRMNDQRERYELRI
jgi:hypothetical protein